MPMDIEISTFNLSIPANRDERDITFEMEASVRIEKSHILLIEKLAKEKVAEKFPEAINPKVCKIYFSRKESEDYLTIAAEINIGDGDYINRFVQIQLPNIIWKIGDK